MQVFISVFEAVFDISYLIIILTLGFIMLLKAKSPLLKLYGFMALILGFGDAFHLVPRIYALLFSGFDCPNTIFYLGVGKLLTSITMTVFYVILLFIWKRLFNKRAKALTITILVLAVIRIALCLMPQNEWVAITPPAIWNIYRNIPFLIIGLLIVGAFVSMRKWPVYAPYKHMALAISLSFAFYIPVVLWAHIVPPIGMLMMPKTLAYVWIVYMGYKEYKRELAK